ncbi:hypothetical protein [Streptomyces sp. NPDC127084]|uniref:hypothetical protein n=1 Tax=Streptomyces sp. NPDC127084 TaxID=3347133 RepID=UPI00364D838D
MNTLIRQGLAATGLAAALMLTGCGSGDDTTDKSDKDTSPAPSAATGGGSGGTSGGADLTALQGTWSAMGSEMVALSFQDDKVSLIAGPRVCTGLAKAADKPTLTLKCADGDTERTAGTVESHDARTVVVSWESGVKDSLTKTDTSGLPSGLPTTLPTGIPTSMPTDLPKGLPTAVASAVPQ